MAGDIVLTAFDFTDLSGSKKRPVLVVADVGLPGMGDWIVCELTSRTRAARRLGDYATGY